MKHCKGNIPSLSILSHIDATDIHVMFRNCLDNGEFILISCPTYQMIADILTKPLQGAFFFTLRDLLLRYTTADSKN